MKQIKSKVSKANWYSVSILAFSLVLIPVFLQAKEYSDQEVRAAVETWVRQMTAEARPDAVVENMEPYEVNGKTVAYVAHLQVGGFCICGANELLLPVYLYAPEGTYDESNPACQYVLWEAETRLANLEKALDQGDPRLQQYQESLSLRAMFWKDLKAGRVPAGTNGAGTQAEPYMMELNLTSRWHQHPPYNNYCPMGDGGRCVVGCVATATAQIMRYWNWPPSGSGTKSYTWDGDDSCDGPVVGGGTLSATFSDPYDWNNMPDHCQSGCSETQKRALAELCYEVGVALRMDYGVCGSGASSGNINNALIDRFRYDGDATGGSRNIDKMTKEIQWLRPIAFCGWNDYAGHCWVVFGYNKATDPNRQFKMHLGWGGYPAWYTCDNVPLSLTESQYHVTRIAPKGVVRFVGDTDPGDGSPNDPYENICEAVAEVPNGTALVFRAGSENTFSGGTLVITRPLTLKGKNVTIRRQ
jgi:hypothetical protein